MTKKLNSLLVCLDLSPHDRYCVEYAQLLASSIDDLEEVVLFHNIRFDFIDALEGFNDSSAFDLKKRVSRHLNSSYSLYFSDSGTRLVIEVEDQNDTVEAIGNRLTGMTDVLLLFGNKAPYQGTGDVVFRMLSLKKPDTPVLLCPQKESPSLGYIAAALDLNPRGRDTVLVSFINDISEYLTDSRMVGIHVNKMPVVYFPYVNREDETIEQELNENSRIRFQKLAAQLKQSFHRWELKIISGKDISKSLVEFSEKQSVDLLVIGKHGNSFFEPGLLGGIARKTAVQSSRTAILIV